MRIYTKILVLVLIAVPAPAHIGHAAEKICETWKDYARGSTREDAMRRAFISARKGAITACERKAGKGNCRVTVTGGPVCDVASGTWTCKLHSKACEK